MNFKIFGRVTLNNEVLAIKDMSLSFSGPSPRPGNVIYFFNICFSRTKNHPFELRNEYEFSHYGNNNFFNEFSSECKSSKKFKAYTGLHHAICDSRESYDTNSFKSDFMDMTISPLKDIFNISIDCDLIGDDGEFTDKPLKFTSTFSISKNEFEEISNIR